MFTFLFLVVIIHIFTKKQTTNWTTIDLITNIYLTTGYMFYRLCYPKRSQYLTVSIKEAAFSIHIIWLDTFMSKILPRILFIIKAMYSRNTQYSIFDIYYISPITWLLPLYINSPLARNMIIEHICIKYWAITVSLTKSKICTQYRIMILLFSYLRHFHHNYCDLILILLWNKDSYSLYILYAAQLVSISVK